MILSIPSPASGTYHITGNNSISNLTWSVQTTKSHLPQKGPESQAPELLYCSFPPLRRIHHPPRHPARPARHRIEARRPLEQPPKMVTRATNQVPKTCHSRPRRVSSRGPRASALQLAGRAVEPSTGWVTVGRSLMGLPAWRNVDFWCSSKPTGLRLVGSAAQECALVY